jgi:hypothetical protein
MACYMVSFFGLFAAIPFAESSNGDPISGLFPCSPSVFLGWLCAAEVSFYSTVWSELL